MAGMAYRLAPRCGAPRWGKAAAFCIALHWAPLAVAGVARDESASGDSQSIDEITVTGTKVQVPGLTSSSPIVSLGGREIEAGQPAAVEELLRTMPSVTPAIGPGVNNGANGAATINLRGLGTNRSLVLVDGRRIVPFSLAGEVDTNVIPTALIERIDLMTGGASTVYGADALTGVTNFILRRNFEGVELSSSYGTSEDGDAGRRRADLTVGGNFDHADGNIVAAFGYTSTSALRQGSRPYGVTTIDSSTGLPSGSNSSVPAVMYSPTANGGTPLPHPPLQIDLASGRLVPVYSQFNFNPDNFYQTPLERYQGSVFAHYTWSDLAELYADFRYVRSDVADQLAPTGTFMSIFQLPIGNPFIPDPARQQLCAARNIPLSECVAGNPTLIPLKVSRRFVELDPRNNDFATTNVQGSIGLKGTITAPWRYDLYFSEGHSDQTNTYINGGSYSRVQQALLATDRGACLDPSGGCVPLDIFGAAGSVTPAMANFINLDGVTGQYVRQRVASATLTGETGPGLRSPLAAEPIGMAFGYEYRRMEAGNSSDAATQTSGELLGMSDPTPDRRGAFTLHEFSAEALAPLISERALADSLLAETGLRYTRFTTISTTDYVTWKVGGTWSPTKDFSFRTSLQHATRAPNINELYAPQYTISGNLDTDPCAGTAISASQANQAGTLSNLCRQTGVPLAEIGILNQPSLGTVNVSSRGNPDLLPEKARTLTAGAVIHPERLKSLTLTLDYFDIDIGQTIGNPNFLDILSRCYSPSLNPGYSFNSACAFIARDGATGMLDGHDVPGVIQQTSNQGHLDTSGIDFSVAFAMRAEEVGLGENWGRLDLNLLGSWVRTLTYQTDGSAPKISCVGFYGTHCESAFGGVNPRLKYRLRTTWSVDDWEVGVLWRHIGQTVVEPYDGRPFLPGFSKISSFDYLDADAAWQITGQVRLYLTILNLADRRPPMVGATINATGVENSGNTYPETYDAIGRYATLGIRLKF